MSDTIWNETQPEVPTFTANTVGGGIDTPTGIPAANVADLPPAVPSPTPTVPSEYKGLSVRADGDKVFLLKGGKRYWITSAQIYSKLGFKFGDEAKIDQATLNVIPEGDPLR